MKSSLAFANACNILGSTFQGTPLCGPIPNDINNRATTVRCNAEDESSNRRKKRPPRRPSAFENTIDDLTMKRLGRGSIYYGTREESAIEEPVADEEDDGFLKPDPVLVTGATGRTGQWISLGLMNQDFNVRCFSRNFGGAEKIFGPSGSNLDVFQGDVANFDQVYDAVDGSVAIVCASGAPWWIPGGFQNVDVKGVQNLIDAAKKTGTVKRFVLISSLDDSGGLGKAKRQAEQIVIDSGVPYVILRAAKLSDSEGGLSKIYLSTENAPLPSNPVGQLSRLDLAQTVCQTLVYNRKVDMLAEEDPKGEFDFPSCVINVENGADPYVPDQKFWRKEFNRISDAYRDKAYMDSDAEENGSVDRKETVMP